MAISGLLLLGLILPTAVLITLLTRGRLSYQQE
jgi:hypothetical protein